MGTGGSGRQAESLTYDMGAQGATEVFRAYGDLVNKRCKCRIDLEALMCRTDGGTAGRSSGTILAATRQAGLLKGRRLWLGARDTDISKKQSVSIGINNRGKVRIAARWGTCVTVAMVPPWAGKLGGKCSVLRGPHS